MWDKYFCSSGATPAKFEFAERYYVTSLRFAEYEMSWYEKEQWDPFQGDSQDIPDASQIWMGELGLGHMILIQPSFTTWNFSVEWISLPSASRCKMIRQKSILFLKVPNYHDFLHISTL